MKMLAAVLPFLCFVLLLKKDRLRDSFIISAVVTGLFITVSTEILSLFDSLAYTPLAACWLLHLVALAAWNYYHRTPHAPQVAGTGTTVFQKVLLAMLFSVVGVTGITAIAAAPNNFDSLTYHLPRVMHWIQNRSVEHYPTHIDRQLLMAPFSEYAIMHLQILSGSDRFANCVQWFSMAGCAVGVSLIARALQGSLNSQIVAAALSVSIPMGLLQATSTQTDYVVSFWLVCLTYFVIETRKHPTSLNTLYVGVSLALAIFTKGTTYLAAVPFMIVYFWSAITRGMKTATANVLIVSVAILLINGGHYARNFKVYGTPISPGSGNSVLSSRVDAAAVISGVTKNIATQLTTGIEQTDSALLALVNGVHRAIGVDVNDADLTADRGFLILPGHVLNSEDYAPNPLHMMLMLLAAATLVWRRKKYSGETILFATATLLSFVALSIGIKWTPFISRYFLSAFIIFSPFVAMLYDGEKLRSVVNSTAAALLALSFIVLANNPMRPIVGPKSVFVTERIDQYFMVNPQAKPYFTATANMIKGQPITNIGILDRDGNMWEYILWVLLKDGGAKYRIEHVEGIKNRSGEITLENFTTYFPVRI